MTVDSIAAWHDAGPGVTRSLELAHRSLVAGGLPVGAVVIGSGGDVVAEGRNRAYDPPGGDDRLQGSPIAHAEMNALARVATSADLSTTTLWSSHRPCAMCAAACEFTGVGRVRFVAPDPSDDQPGPDPIGVDGRWLIVANLLFLAGIRAYSGANAPMLRRARDREPETTDLLDTVAPHQWRTATLPDALGPIWSHVVNAAQRRQLRVGG
ncbi:nucleoside deaminase [Amycolatopsis balhimycina DSM 5908]|uniref:Nucleoside deaminase n=1 Tax=Amycolatopsis balhimycina DSM 5908 TaxID=1081091 RepID=A0A428WSI9_AMYBA|nr:nucleoside deaminase [Amycolatopsis balhimycina]RSM46029.1 nucleoside deaminase [Amycolatopsis balhimycina DSM 5908]